VTELKILLAEDDPDDQQFFIEALRELHPKQYAVAAVYTGREALDYLQAGNSPDLIVLDLNMPLMDGYQVLKTLKSSASYQSIPAFVLTTSSEKHEGLRCRELGCSGFYTKPLSLRELTHIVDDMLSKARISQ
jgi:CheY-like chemotaxis protein